jgi:hypothetical protein
MATKRRQGTFEKVRRTVKGTAKTVAEAAGKYVVKPMERALGMGNKKKPAKRRKSNTSRSVTKASKKPSARKTTRKTAKAAR